jgi:hypothetical protein
MRMGRRFRNHYEAEKADLLRRAREAAPRANRPDSGAELPQPVRRYLEVTRAFREPGLRAAILKERGSLRTGPGKAWMPFESEQAYSMEPPGFVWYARASVVPLVSMLARDKFVDGEGHMLVSLLGLITVADRRGPEMDLGAGLRYWGEIVSFPEMATSRYLRWKAMGEHRARLQIEHAGLGMSATIDFGEDGYPTTIHAERYRDVDGIAALTPWSGVSRHWTPFGNRLFPAHWESVWHLPEGDFTAVRMEVLAVRTE